MTLNELISASYWFSDPGFSDTILLKAILVVFLLLLITGIFLRFYFRRGTFHPVMRKFLKPIPGRLMRWGILGLLLIWFRYEGSHYLSWRFLWLIFAVWIIYVLVKDIRFFRSEYPKRMEMYGRRNEGREWEIKAKSKSKKKKRG